MAAAEETTELEGIVLGILWKGGPQTPYAVRRVFLDSKNPTWSGSAGAIYPLLRRLERRGLLRSSDTSVGDRPGRLFVLTAGGRHALRHWIGRPDPAAVGVPPDPLRTRAGFLGALPPAGRKTFLREARRRVGEERDRLHAEERRVRESGDRWNALLIEAAGRSMSARLAWIEKALANVEGISVAGANRPVAARSSPRPGRRSGAAGPRSRAAD